MITKIRISNAFADKQLGYNRAKNILQDPISRNFITDIPCHAREMRDTLDLYGKSSSDRARKTVGIILSPAPADSVTPERLVFLANALLDKYMPYNQAEIVVHHDKGPDSNKTEPKMHCHICVNAVDPINGRTFHLSNKERLGIETFIENLARDKFGWMIIDRSNRIRKNPKNSEIGIRRLLDGNTYSWKVDLSNRVWIAYSKATSFSDFINRLKSDGIILSLKDKSGKEMEQYRFSFIGADGKHHRCNGPRLNPLLDKKTLRNHFDRSSNANQSENDRRTGGITGESIQKAKDDNVGRVSRHINIDATVSPSNEQAKFYEGGCESCPSEGAARSGLCANCLDPRKLEKGKAKGFSLER